ncbi:MAG: isoprenylcysteine carboxylmethyltransferase family protein [Candidatus Bathyarchaeota archaeon]|nr:MAG: isoprenylcysteine carboxylmethyltransferase family protein [Candidatus Bathyarchaeota archaeon]
MFIRRTKEDDEIPQIDKRQLSTYLLIFIVAPILTYAIGGWIDSTLSLPRFPPFPINLLVGFGVFFSGLAIGIKSTRRLYREGLGLPWGEAVRETRTSKLVTTGLYAYTRNPMVLGYSMLPCGMGILFRSLGMAIPITTIVLLVNIILVKTKEEPGLEERFGEEYRAYRRRTPFLIPRMGALPKVVSTLIGSDDEKTKDAKG